MKLYCAHAIPLSAEAFWDVLHAPRYEALVAEAAGLHAYEELERRDEPDAVYRKILSRPELPTALRSLFDRIAPNAGAPSYVEEQWRAKDRMEVRWRMRPSVLSDHARIEGVVRIEPRGAKRCERVLDGVVEVQLFGVGRLLEKAIVAATVDAYAKGAAAAAKL
ncbi:MAG: hypothetical protein DCC71_24470 [Proteobacteria bacterium]|nr:MAG: hypothetical protein DCC71_24470 [Pseudomonadota bacterium]